MQRDRSDLRSAGCALLGGLIPLLVGLIIAVFFYRECFSASADTPSNEQRQLLYDRLWIMQVKARDPRGKRKWNGVFFVTLGCLLVAVGLILLLINPS